MPRRLIALAFVLAGSNTAIADDMKMPINSGDLKWGPAPPALPKGAEITVLSGDPSKDGPFVLRLKMPSGYKVPAHNHPTDEIISGNFHIGMGDKFDENKAIELTAGGYAEAPAKMNHYACGVIGDIDRARGGWRIACCAGPSLPAFLSPTSSLAHLWKHPAAGGSRRAQRKDPVPTTPDHLRLLPPMLPGRSHGLYMLGATLPVLFCLSTISRPLSVVPL